MWNLANQLIPIERQIFQFGEVAQLGRDLSGQLVVS